MAPADFGITQFFFDADHYRRMVDDLGDLGCDPPLLPGVITVTNPTSVKRFAGIHVYTLNAGFRMPARSAGCSADCRRVRNR